MDKDTKLNKEDMDNLVAVFSLLLKWDVEQNPHLYKKRKNSPKSLGNRRKTDTPIRSENS
jgi:hypothetical protein